MLWYKLMSINWRKFEFNPLRSPKLLWGSLFGIGGLLYLKVWVPLTGIGVPCIFHELTGLYCPGCGITRTVLSLLSLDFHQAFRFNPLLVFLLPLYIAYSITNRKRMNISSNVIITIMLTMTISF